MEKGVLGHVMVPLICSLHEKQLKSIMPTVMGIW